MPLSMLVEDGAVTSPGMLRADAGCDDGVPLVAIAFIALAALMPRARADGDARPKPASEVELTLPSSVREE